MQTFAIPYEPGQDGPPSLWMIVGGVIIVYGLYGVYGTYRARRQSGDGQAKISGSSIAAFGFGGLLLLFGILELLFA